MKGALIVVPAATEEPVYRLDLMVPVKLYLLQWILGGHIETIPYLNTYEAEGEEEPGEEPPIVECVAFCNEEGKMYGLPLNQRAQTLWVQSLIRKFGVAAANPQDILVGPVILIIGDEELLGSI